MQDTRTYLEKLKPMLYAMSLDYSVVPTLLLEIEQFIQAHAEDNIGRDTGGSVEITPGAPISKAEANDGKDATSKISFGINDIYVSGEGNLGIDASELLLEDVELTVQELTIESGVGAFATSFMLDAIESSTEANFDKHVARDANSICDIHCNPISDFDSVLAKEAIATSEAEASMSATASTDGIKLAEIYDGISEAEILLEADPCSMATKQPNSSQEIEYTLEASIQRTNGKRFVGSSETECTISLLVGKKKHATINDVANKTLASFFNDSIMRSTIIPA